MGPGRALGPDGADIRRMSFLFFSKRSRCVPYREGAALFCGSIPLGCCFSFFLALFIWAGRGTIQTVKKTKKPAAPPRETR